MSNKIVKTKGIILGETDRSSLLLQLRLFHILLRLRTLFGEHSQLAAALGMHDRGLQLLAGDVHGPQVSQHQVIVGAAGDQVEAFVQQRLSHDLGVGNNIVGVGLEIVAHSFLQAHCLGSNDALQLAAR